MLFHGDLLQSCQTRVYRAPQFYGEGDQHLQDMVLHACSQVTHLSLVRLPARHTKWATSPSVNSYTHDCHLNHDDIIGMHSISYNLHMPLPSNRLCCTENSGAKSHVRGWRCFQARRCLSRLPPSWNQFIFFWGTAQENFPFGQGSCHQPRGAHVAEQQWKLLPRKFELHTSNSYISLLVTYMHIHPTYRCQAPMRTHALAASHSMMTLVMTPHHLTRMSISYPQIHCPLLSTLTHCTTCNSAHSRPSWPSLSTNPTWNCKVFS